MAINVKQEKTMIYNTRAMPVRLHTMVKKLAAERRSTMEQIHAEALEIGLGVIEARVAEEQYREFRGSI